MTLPFLYFKLDQLPFSFSYSSEAVDSDTFENGGVNNAVRISIHLIRDAGGLAFHKMSSSKISRHFYYFSCCQDVDHCKKSKSGGKRDYRQMERIRCNSILTMNPDSLDRLLHIQLQHWYHILYLDIRPSQEALEFIDLRDKCQTPAEIFRNLPLSEIYDVDVIAQHQLYHQWQRKNSGIWGPDADQFDCATKFLSRLKIYTAFWITSRITHEAYP